MTVEPDITTMADDLTKLLTMIARASLDDHHSADFASILTGSLTAAAANVGDPEAVLAGRPGSWEASHLRDLLQGALGPHPDDWWAFMTEPVTIRLNVAELVEDPALHPGLVGLDDAQSRLGDDFDHHPTTYRAYEAALDTLTKRYIEALRTLCQAVHRCRGSDHNGVKAFSSGAGDHRLQPDVALVGRRRDPQLCRSRSRAGRPDLAARSRHRPAAERRHSS